MTPEQTLRQFRPEYEGHDREFDAALDALVAERDALAARLAEAERTLRSVLAQAEESRKESAEALLEQPHVSAYVVTRRFEAIENDARDALAAADRPEGTTTQEGNA